MALAMLGKWEEAANDLHLASKLDYDEEINAILKKVEPNAHKIEEHAGSTIAFEGRELRRSDRRGSITELMLRLPMRRLKEHSSRCQRSRSRAGCRIVECLVDFLVGRHVAACLTSSLGDLQAGSQQEGRHVTADAVKKMLRAWESYQRLLFSACTCECACQHA